MQKKSFFWNKDKSSTLKTEAHHKYCFIAFYSALPAHYKTLFWPKTSAPYLFYTHEQKRNSHKKKVIPSSWKRNIIQFESSVILINFRNLMTGWTFLQSSLTSSLNYIISTESNWIDSAGKSCLKKLFLSLFIWAVNMSTIHCSSLEFFLPVFENFWTNEQTAFLLVILPDNGEVLKYMFCNLFWLVLMTSMDLFTYLRLIFAFAFAWVYWVRIRD